MRINRSTLTRLLGAMLVFGLLAVLLSGCEADTPQNTFAAEGEVARDQRDLFYYAMWPAIVIMVFVELGLVVTLLRFRRRRDDEVPTQTHGNTRLELAWTIAPAALLLVLAVPMMTLLFKLGDDPGEDAFTVNVTGFQWLWQFEYPQLEVDGEPLKTTNEVYFPAGQKVRFNVTAFDVIHSFWIPRLGGKLDAVPGRTNTFWLVSDGPRSFAGQCAEFCGLRHAEMKLVAHALSEDDFDAWVNEQGAARISNSASGASPTPSPSR